MGILRFTCALKWGKYEHLRDLSTAIIIHLLMRFIKDCGKLINILWKTMWITLFNFIYWNIRKWLEWVKKEHIKNWDWGGFGEIESGFGWNPRGWWWYFWGGKFGRLRGIWGGDGVRMWVIFMVCGVEIRGNLRGLDCQKGCERDGGVGLVESWNSSVV